MHLSRDNQHPRQCQAMLKRHGGRQCRRFALVGANYCQFHGGRNRKARGQVRINHLPFFYRKYLSPTLTAKVEELLNVAPDEQINLFEELALMRTMAGEAVQLYGLAEEKGSPEQRTEAALLMRSALRDVVQTCEAASRVVASGKDKVSVHDIQFVVNQIIRVAHATLEEEDAMRFEESLRRDVRIPGRTEQGTHLTPDNDVSMMDATIPHATT